MQTLGSRIVYQNRWMTVREDEIRRADGSKGIFGVVEKPDAAMVIPVEHGRVHMVQQFKYAVGGRFWEFPQGTWEQASQLHHRRAGPRRVARGDRTGSQGDWNCWPASISRTVF